MKKMLLFVLVLFLGTLVGGPAQATTIDFEDLTLYSEPASIIYPGVTFTEIYTGLTDPTFFVDSTTEFHDPPYTSALPVGPPLNGKVIVGESAGHEGEAYLATFSIPGVRFVSVDIGDISTYAAGTLQDVDHIFLNAYRYGEGGDILLASIDATLPDSDTGINNGLNLSVSTSEDIDYVTFGTDYSFTSSGGMDYSTAGSVYFDNFTYVPLPGAVWLLGSGLLGLAGWRRFKRS